MRRRESQPDPKPFEEMSGQERINHILRGLPPGSVYADPGYASAEDTRKLSWQLTRDEKKVVDLFTGHQVDELKKMTPEQLAERGKKICKLLGIEAVASTDLGYIEFE